MRGDYFSMNTHLKCVSLFTSGTNKGARSWKNKQFHQEKAQMWHHRCWRSDKPLRKLWLTAHQWKTSTPSAAPGRPLSERSMDWEQNYTEKRLWLSWRQISVPDCNEVVLDLHRSDARCASLSVSINSCSHSCTCLQIVNCQARSRPRHFFVFFLLIHAARFFPPDSNQGISHLNWTHRGSQVNESGVLKQCLHLGRNFGDLCVFISGVSYNVILVLFVFSCSCLEALSTSYLSY